MNQQFWEDNQSFKAQNCLLEEVMGNKYYIDSMWLNLIGS